MGVWSKKAARFCACGALEQKTRTSHVCAHVRACDNHRIFSSIAPFSPKNSSGSSDNYRETLGFMVVQGVEQLLHLE